MRNMSDIVRNKDPVTLPPSATVKEACRYMRNRRVGAVLVTEGQHLLGIFTGRDAVHRVLAEGKSAARTKLAEVMTPDPDTMPLGKTAIEALRLMEGGVTATCRLSTGAGLWALFPASISVVSNWTAWTKKPVCGRGSDARNQCTTTAELEARLCAEPNRARSSRDPARWMT